MTVKCLLQPIWVGSLVLLIACERPAIRPYECDEHRAPIAKHMRTTCDFYRRYVIPVFSCADPHLRPDPGKQLGDNIIDLLLSKGHNCTDPQMIAAIANFVADYFDREYAIRKMQQIAVAEAPPVRAAACHWLSSWKQPCPNSLPK